MQLLIYASRQAAAAGEVDHAVGEIIRASIRNNRKRSITGLLLVHEGYFLQALEGPAPAVEATYLRIARDPRHRDSKVLLRQAVARRDFGGWNMCARHITPGDDAILDTMAERFSFDPFAFSGATARRLLKAVRGIQERTQLAALK